MIVTNVREEWFQKTDGDVPAIKIADFLIAASKNHIILVRHLWHLFGSRYLEFFDSLEMGSMVYIVVDFDPPISKSAFYNPHSIRHLEGLYEVVDMSPSSTNQNRAIIFRKAL